MVLEEDAVLDASSLERLHLMLADMKGVPWDLIMLESGHLGLTGSWRYVGQNVATCANWTTETCTWMGSRGYLITKQGADVLLRNAKPYVVQTDAVMALTATFDPTFKMYWTTQDIAYPTYLRRSSIWDGCVKCYAPLKVVWYVLLLGVLLASAIAICFLVYRVDASKIYIATMFRLNPNG
jgi:hypothetical protein